MLLLLRSLPVSVLVLLINLLSSKYQFLCEVQVQIYFTWMYGSRQYIFNATNYIPILHLLWNE
jgi:hypothetical protein